MKRFTKEEDAYIRLNYPLNSTRVMAAHLGRSPASVQNRAYEIGVRKAKHGARDRAGPWQHLDDLLQLLYPDMQNQDIADFFGVDRKTICKRASDLKLKKGAKIKKEIQDARANNLRKTRSGEFKKGLIPWNTGMRDSTMFKGGVAPHASPVGTERIRYLNKGTKQELAYVERRLDKPARWERVHTIVWKEANGPVPKGYVVAFKPGMHTIKSAEITLDKLECVSRAEIGTRNLPLSISPEYAALCQLRGKITQQVNRIAKEQG